MLNLTPAGAVILTSRLLTYNRTSQETAAKLNRSNFLHRVCAVSTVLANAGGYEEAAAALIEAGWFSELGQTALATAIEAEADDLMNHAMSLGVPIDGLLAVKSETTQNPIEPQVTEDDIPI